MLPPVPRSRASKHSRRLAASFHLARRPLGGNASLAAVRIPPGETPLKMCGIPSRPALLQGVQWGEVNDGCVRHTW